MSPTLHALACRPRAAMYLRLNCLCVLLAAAAGAQDAAAHAEAGDRLFAGTLTFDDPAVVDEISGPQWSRQRVNETTRDLATDDALSMAISRRLTGTLSLGAQIDWARQTEAGESSQGLSARHIFLKQQWWKDDERESLGSVGVSLGFGGAGNPDLHSHSYNTVETTFAFAQGMSPSLAPWPWLRSWAVSGAIKWDQPTISRSSPEPGEPLAGTPTIIHSGLSLQYTPGRRTPAQDSASTSPSWIGLVEFQWDSPINGGYGTKTAATMNPGIAIMGHTLQWSIEALIPLNQEAGKPGLRAGLTVFLDECLPRWFAQPLFQR